MTRRRRPIGMQTLRELRDYLRGLYGVIRTADAHVRFTLL